MDIYQELKAKVEGLPLPKLLCETLKDKADLHEIFSFFCHSRHAEENLLVWNAIQKWKSDPQLEPALDILETFIKEGGDNQVNVTYGTWKRLENVLEGPEVPENGTLTGKEFRFVEEEVFNLMLVSLIHPFQLQFSDVLEDFKNKDKGPSKKDRHSNAFLNDGGLAAHPNQSRESFFQAILRVIFFWR